MPSEEHEKTRAYEGAPTEPERARKICEGVWMAHQHEIDERVVLFQGIPLPIEAVSYEDLEKAYYITGAALGRSLAIHAQIVASRNRS